MKLFLDTEFNGFGGELISMGIYAEDGKHFYEVLGCSNPSNWVAENVIKKLDKPAVSIDRFRSVLCNFLNKFKSVEIVADWAEDIKHFCDVIQDGKGGMMPFSKIKIEIIVGLKISSENPHNALSDAIALKDAYYANL